MGMSQRLVRSKTFRIKRFGIRETIQVKRLAGSSYIMLSSYGDSTLKDVWVPVDLAPSIAELLLEYARPVPKDTKPQ